MISYRELPAEEWFKLAEVFKQYDTVLPNPQLARIFVAEDDEQVIGFIVAQVVFHAEPLWIKPGYGGKASWKHLVEMVDELFSKDSPTGGTYYIFSPNGKIGRMAQINGMTELPWSVWKKEL